jgi:hypothetical protein
MTVRQLSPAFAVLLVLPMMLFAQTTRPDDTLLGVEWDGSDVGIAFRPPADCTEIQRGLGSDELVRFVHEQRKWVLTVARITLEKAVPLQTRRSINGEMLAGYLDATVAAVTQQVPGKVLRKEIIYLPGGGEAGVFATHYTLGTETQLMQRALVRLSDKQYYVFTFTVPAPRENVATDPGIVRAVATFNAMLDSVRLIDQTKLRLDQEDRLIRARRALVNMTEGRLRQSLVPEQWVRLIRNGKDIGYSYIVEEVGTDIPRKGVKPQGGGPEGVLIGVRSRSWPDGKMQVDAESWMWMAFDRKQENWSSLVVTNRGKQDESYSSEVGFSIRRSKPSGDKLIDEWTLDVRYAGKRQALDSVERQLPPFYLPQALSHLLPRVVPLRQPDTYMFASYVPERREVMSRYLDVRPEAEVVFNGKLVRAIVIEDRVGLRGSPTLHYFVADGTYLGSENRDSKILLLPTDVATLRGLWKDLELTRPSEVDRN